MKSGDLPVYLVRLERFPVTRTMERVLKLGGLKFCVKCVYNIPFILSHSYTTLKRILFLQLSDPAAQNRKTKLNWSTKKNILGNLLVNRFLVDHFVA